MLTKNQLQDVTRITGATLTPVNQGNTTSYAFKHRGHKVWIESTNKRIRKDLNFFLYVDKFDCGTGFMYISELFNSLKNI